MLGSLGGVWCPGCKQSMGEGKSVMPYHEGTQGGDFPKRMLCAECYITDCQKAANKRLKDRPDNGNDEGHYRYGGWEQDRYQWKKRP